MTKVYLAKSNRSNPDDVAAVRRFLSEYKNDIEVVEFKGGSYSHTDLLNCDLLLIVPDLTAYNKDENYIGLGKGLHEQIQVFQHHNNECDVLMVYDINKDTVFVSGVEDLDVSDTDDYINYSFVIFDPSDGEPLNAVIDNRFDYQPIRNKNVNKNNTSYSDYMYLLIGR